MLQQGMLGKDRELVFQSRNRHSTFPPETGLLFGTFAPRKHYDHTFT